MRKYIILFENYFMSENKDVGFESIKAYMLKGDKKSVKYIKDLIAKGNYQEMFDAEYADIKKISDLCGMYFFDLFYSEELIIKGVLNHFPTELGMLPNLQVLNLSDNNILEMPNSISGFAKLEALRLNNNSIKTVPKNIASLKKLKLLNLGYNKFDIIPIEICQLSNLTELNMSFNLIENIPSEIKNLKKLKELVLSNNHISEVPADFFDLSKIQRVWLTNNKIETLPDEIEFCTSLKDFRVSAKTYKGSTDKNPAIGLY
jgi:Leucine-rich repeat (LRR) protein